MGRSMVLNIYKGAVVAGWLMRESDENCHHREAKRWCSEDWQFPIPFDHSQTVTDRSLTKTTQRPSAWSSHQDPKWQNHWWLDWTMETLVQGLYDQRVEENVTVDLFRWFDACNLWWSSSPNRMRWVQGPSFDTSCLLTYSILDQSSPESSKLSAYKMRIISFMSPCWWHSMYTPASECIVWKPGSFLIVFAKVLFHSIYRVNTQVCKLYLPFPILWSLPVVPYKFLPLALCAGMPIDIHCLNYLIKECCMCE